MTLGLGSVTETPLDATDKSTLTDSQSYDPYRAVVNVTAATIVDDGVVRSHAGTVQFNAQDPTGATSPRIYLDSNSIIDVSGVAATISHASDFATFKVTSNELKNAPDQKTGILKGATVTVDLRKNSNVLDLSGYQANRPRTLAEKASSAGSVTLTSGSAAVKGDLIQRAGSLIDASAGSINRSGRRLEDDATPRRRWQGLRHRDRARGPGLRQPARQRDDHGAALGSDAGREPAALSPAVFEPGSRFGANGGDIAFVSHGGLVIDGSLRAGTTAGPGQMTNAPRAGSLSIGDVNTQANPPDYGTGNVEFVQGTADTLGAGFNASSILQPGRQDTLILSADLFAPSAPDASGRNFVQAGFDGVSIGANGRISLPRGVTLAGGAGRLVLVLGAADRHRRHDRGAGRFDRAQRGAHREFDRARVERQLHRTRRHAVGGRAVGPTARSSAGRACRARCRLARPAPRAARR